MKIEVGKQYRVKKNRDSYYGDCDDIIAIENEVVTVTHDFKDGDFDIKDINGLIHVCQPENLEEVSE